MKWMLSELKVPCVCVKFKYSISPDPDRDVSELLYEQAADKVRGMPVALAKKTKTAIQFLAITGMQPHEDLDTLERERSWWQFHYHEEGTKAESIPLWKGERLRTRLLNMDFKAFADLNASEFDLLYHEG